MGLTGVRICIGAVAPDGRALHPPARSERFGVAQHEITKSCAEHEALVNEIKVRTAAGSWARACVRMYCVCMPVLACTWVGGCVGALPFRCVWIALRA